MRNIKYNYKKHKWIKVGIVILYILIVFFLCLVTNSKVGWLFGVILLGLPKWYDIIHFKNECKKYNITMFEYVSDDIPQEEKTTIKELRKLCISDKKMFFQYNQYISALTSAKKITKEQYNRLIFESTMAEKSKKSVEIE